MSFIVLAFLLIPIQFIAQGESTKQPIVYYIPVEQAVERGLEAFIKRSINDAIEEGADHIVLEINTPGGQLMQQEILPKLFGQQKYQLQHTL